MTRVLQPKSLEDRVDELEAKLAALETFPSFGAARTKGGTTYWADTAGADQITIGQQADGSYAVKVAGVTIYATGPNAGKILGLVALALTTLTASGDVTGARGVFAASGINTGNLNFKFVKTSATRLDITTS